MLLSKSVSFHAALLPVSPPSRFIHPSLHLDSVSDEPFAEIDKVVMRCACAVHHNRAVERSFKAHPCGMPREREAHDPQELCAKGCHLRLRIERMDLWPRQEHAADADGTEYDDVELRLSHAAPEGNG